MTPAPKLIYNEPDVV